MKFHFKMFRFSVKSRFKEWKRADSGHSLNQDFTVHLTFIRLLPKKQHECNGQTAAPFKAYVHGVDGVIFRLFFGDYQRNCSRGWNRRLIYQGHWRRRLKVIFIHMHRTMLHLQFGTLSCLLTNNYILLTAWAEKIRTLTLNRCPFGVFQSSAKIYSVNIKLY